MSEPENATPAILYLKDVAAQFHKLKELAEKALAQVRAEDFFTTLDPESNSLGTLMQHLGGNLRSRWTDFLFSDGEKPDRDRDREFEIEAGTTREHLFGRWEEGWRCVFQTLAALSEEHLTMTVLIRAEPHSVVKAIDRSLTHVAYHVGQIVFLAKHLASDHWRTLSVERGRTREFNEKMMGGSSTP